VNTASRMKQAGPVMRAVIMTGLSCRLCRFKTWIRALS
jgi:hypothetical protein